MGPELVRLQSSKKHLTQLPHPRSSIHMDPMQNSGLESVTVCCCHRKGCDDRLRLKITYTYQSNEKTD
jgi:hypothetical protein